MYNHYLLNSKPDIDIMDNYKNDEVKVEIENIKSTEKYQIKISLKGKSLKNAGILDNIQEAIKERYSDVIILASGSSKYYNQRLYPLINDMERKLRNLLYLANALMDKEYEGIIKNLEDMDFGDIYKLLFLDTEFMSYIRDILKKGKKGIFNNNEFTKDDLLKILYQKEESVLWDKILYNNAVPTLRSNFIQIREYRNNVMHAYNINQYCYRDAKKLYENINRELDEEIGKIKTSPVVEVNENISEILSTTLASIDASNYTRAVNEISDTISKLAYNSQLNEISEIVSRISENSGIKETAERMKAVSSLNKSYINAIKNIFETIQLPRLDLNKNLNFPEYNKRDDNLDDYKENNKLADE